MSDSPSTTAADLAVHDDLIAAALPGWFTQADPGLLADYLAAAARSEVSAAQARQVLDGLQSPEAFVRPLLEAQLKRQYNVQVDTTAYELVNAEPSNHPLFDFLVLNDSTLLAAALNNFSAEQAAGEGFADGAALLPVGVLRYELPAGGKALVDYQYRYDRRQRLSITPAQFAKLCRELDAGKAYLAHFHAHVQPLSSRVPARDAAQGDVAAALFFSEQDRLEAAAHLALLKGDIERDSFDMLISAAANRQGVAQWGGRPARYAWLRILNTASRTGVALWHIRVFERSDSDRRCVVYRPGDNDNPLKEYPSFEAFTDTLREQLRDSRQRDAFERYISLRDRPDYNRRLSATLAPAPLHVLIPQPGVPDANADIGLERVPFELPLVRSLYDDLVTRLGEDARARVVPTADQDSRSREARIRRWLAMEMNLVNLAAFLVPGVGEVMAAVGAVQLLGEVFVGVDDWRHGQRTEALLHVAGVVQNLAMMAAAAPVVSAVGSRLKAARSQWVARMAPVTDAAGRRRLWDGDLQGYAADVVLPESLEANARGQYSHGGKTYIKLQGRLHEQRYDPASGEWTLRHPDERNGYHPSMTDNAAGAWRHAHEDPLAWSADQLVERLGPRAEGFDPQTLTRIRQCSGISEDALRGVHEARRPIPALLDDTLRLFSARRQVDLFISQLRAGQPHPPAYLHGPALMVRMPRWPRQVAVQVVDPAVPGQAVRYEAPGAIEPVTLAVTREGVLQGRLADEVVTGLSGAQLDALLGDDVGSRVDQRVTALREQLADFSEGERAELVASVLNDADQARSRNPLAQVLLRDFPGLGRVAAEEVAAQASAAERTRLGSAGKIPVRLAEIATLYLRDLRLNRALSGLFAGAPVPLDSDRLLFNLLEHLPGWAGEQHLKLSRGNLDVALGDTRQPARQISWRNGLYQSEDAAGNSLRGGPRLADAVLGALPDSARLRLGFDIHEGERLQQRLIQLALSDRPRAARALGQRSPQPLFRLPVRQPSGLIGYELSGRLSGLLRTPAQRRLAKLYPDLDTGELRAMLADFGDQATLTLAQREADFAVLEKTLAQWQAAPGANEQHAQIAARIKAAWQRRGRRWVHNDGQRGYELNLAGLQVPRLPTLIADMQHVTVLDMSRMQLAQDPSTFLSAFPGVRHLDLTANRLTQVPVQIGSMEALVALNLGSNQLVGSDTLLQPLAGLARLRLLRLSDNPLALPSAAIEHIGGLRALEYLYLQRTELTLNEADCAQLARLRNLVELDLEDNHVELTRAAATKLELLWHLSYLNLARNPLGELPLFSRFDELCNLALNQTGITHWPEGLRELMDQAPLRLEGVELSGNRIGYVPALRDTAFGRASVRSATPQKITLSLDELNAAGRDNAQQMGAINSPLVRTPGSWLEGSSPAVQELVARLRADVHSRAFFRALDRAHDAACYHADPDAFRRRLVRLVKDMAEPERGDDVLGMTDLRDQLYDMASSEEATCGDAVSLVLDRYETAILLYKTARSLGPANAKQTMDFLAPMANQLYTAALLDQTAADLTLARTLRRRVLFPDAVSGNLEPSAMTQDPALIAKAPPLHRLDHLGPLAASDDSLLAIAPDEVEIRLRLRNELAEYLALLPQPPRLYDVELQPQVIRRIGADVKARLSTVDRLDWLAEQPYWQRILQRCYPERFAALNERWAPGFAYLQALEAGEGTSALAVLPDEVLVTLRQAFPASAWVSDGVMQPVALGSDDTALSFYTLNQVLLSGRNAAEHQLVMDLTRPALAHVALGT